MLSLGMDKCAILAVERRKMKPTEDIVLSADKIIETLENTRRIISYIHIWE